MDPLARLARALSFNAPAPTRGRYRVKRKLCLHRRAAHWKDQAFGREWSKHRRIYIESYLAGDPKREPSQQTIAKWLALGITREVLRATRRAA